jgi:hypothetical protein
MKNTLLFLVPIVGAIALIVFFFWLHFFAPCNFVKYLSTAQSLPARCLSNIASNNQTSDISNTNVYIYGTDIFKDQALAAPGTFEQKQQCAKDGTAWYQKNVLDTDTPQGISIANSQSGSNDPSLILQAVYPGYHQYTYSTKLNTCLVDWAQTMTFADGTNYTNHTITDVYANKSIAEWDWSQKPGQSIQDALKSSDNKAYNTAEYNLITQQK